MERIFNYQITKKDENFTISEFLKTKGYSHQNVVALKKIPESILINGKWEYVSYRLKDGDLLTIHVVEKDSNDKILPIPLPLQIVYEDEDILVVNKQADMPIHPSVNNYDNTLANAVAYYYESRNIPFVFRCINRLDRDTTGLTIIAKHMISAGILSSMVARREIKREYQAIIKFTPENALPSSGRIDAPIARKNESVIERCVDPQKGEHAVTHYKVLKVTGENYALLSLHLETGRTHQIRVHMSHLGFPLLGDSLYGGDLSLINRQALHSYKLTFHHPITNEELCFVAQLPDDMANII